MRICVGPCGATIESRTHIVETCKHIRGGPGCVGGGDEEIIRK